MTDYLEELLEQQESQEEGTMPDWRERRLRVWGQQAVGEQPAGGAVTYPHRLPGENDVQALAQAEADAIWQKRMEQLPLMAQMARLHRAVRQVQGQGGGRSGAAQSMVQPGTTQMLHGGFLSVRRAADYAAAVDAAFQRDARRYDGPLGLL